MAILRRRLRAAAAALVAAVATAAFALLAPGAAHAATTLCGEDSTSVSGGTYNLQNNEYNSGASECITTDGGADFTVANSAISTSGGAPGAYPSIYQGCHWGACSSGGLSSDPIQVSALKPGQVTTSWNTSQPGGNTAYDVAYDIWFNQSPTTSGQPNCTEMMIWLNHNGNVGPYGSEVASNASVGGVNYNIWEGGQSIWDTVSYSMTTPSTSVSNLDLYALAQDAVNRGYLSQSCYLIDIEAGFELWQGGAGLATNSFSVNVNNGGGTPPPTGTGQITGYQGLCLDDRGASSADYNPIQVYTCNGTNAQTWSVESNNTLQVLGKCLDVNGAGTANGTAVDLYTCNGTGAQQWVPQSDGALLNPNSGKCLDDTGSGGSGTQVQIWSCGGSANQTWHLP